MFSKDQMKIIELMNTHMGTNHRSKPYNLTKAADLVQALTLAVAAYRDYWYYETTLDNIIGDFDESLEHYDPASWFYMGNAPEKADSLAMDCASALSTAISKFGEIADRARNNLELILKVVLTAPTDTQNEVLGCAYNIGAEEIEEKLEDLFEALDDAEYHTPIPDNFDTFLKVLKKEWSEFAHGV